VSDRFSGIARLYGQSALGRFRRSHVLVVGIGGVGSWAAESLARSGIGRLTLVDPDDVCVTNTNRQLHALADAVGRPKTAVLAERLRRIDPDLVVEKVACFVSERNVAELLEPAPDAVLDAIDPPRAKAALLAACIERAIAVLCSGAAGGRRDPTRIRVADLARSGRDPLLASLRKRLRAEHGFPAAPARGEAPPFGIEAVFSDESPRYPTGDGEVSDCRPASLPGGLRCDAGYGSVTHVTASFGLVAAGRLLERLAADS